MRTATHRLLSIGLLVAVVFVFVPACGDSPSEPAEPPGEPGQPGVTDTRDLGERAAEALAKARGWLLERQDESGAWGDESAGMDPGAALTTMAVTAIIEATPAVEVRSDADIRKALDFLAALQKENGAIYDNPQIVNYLTSAATGAFAAAKIADFRQVEVKARDFLARSQYADDEEALAYGGFPYKDLQTQPPDLSNMQYAAQALHDAGLPEDHEVWKRIQVYLSRVQNRSETNTRVIETTVDDAPATVRSGDDGGAGYYPGNGKAGYVKRADGSYEVRSYGSMTYALLKCLLLSGVDAKDARVVAAMGWITRNFTLERNPGFEAADDPAKAGMQGYYYYLHTMAQTLGAFERETGEPLTVRDAAGTTHDWRAEMIQALLDRQQDDGSWVNAVSSRWEEGAPVLATSYAVVALALASEATR